MRLDEYEQRDRQNHIILSSETDKPNTADDIVTLLNDKMEANIGKQDIRYILKLGKVSDETSRTRVVLNDWATKQRLMKIRKNLKGKRTWLSDDLTIYRSNLAYRARVAVKENKAIQT
jgi:hypothetical protein